MPMIDEQTQFEVGVNNFGDSTYFCTLFFTNEKENTRGTWEEMNHASQTQED